MIPENADPLLVAEYEALAAQLRRCRAERDALESARVQIDNARTMAGGRYRIHHAVPLAYVQRGGGGGWIGTLKAGC